MNALVLTPDRSAKVRQDDIRGQIALLSGRRGVGKTTWCQALVQQARAFGLTVSGLLSPAVFQVGRKIAIDLHDLRSNETRRLAARPAPGAPGTAGLGWRFETATLAWGNRLIEEAGFCDLLVIDELGPLEFRDNVGLNKAFSIIDGRNFRLAVIVVRLELIPVALQRWPGARVVKPLG